MDDLLELLIVVIVAVVAMSQKRKKKRKTAAPRPTKWADVEKTLTEIFDTPTAAKPARPDPMGERTHEGIHPCSEHTVSPAEQLRMNLRPEPVLGSLGEDTHEGMHPCEVHNPAPLAAPLTPEPEEQTGLQLDWTGDSMVKAFIMQEVLTRPYQRKRA